MWLDRKIKTFASVLALISVTGCKSTFTKVDFKYDNLTHMPPEEAMLSLEIDPKTLIVQLSDAFKAQDNLILDREQLDFFYEPSAQQGACWSASQEIIGKEFLAYQNNDFSQYDNIDRKSIFANHGVSNQCTLMQAASDDVAESWFLRVEIPQGNYGTTISVPNVQTFFAISGNLPIYGSSTSYSNRQVQTSFSSRLYIWAWKEHPGDKTKVYLLAKPVNGQVESGAGNSIGYAWWKQANGYAEYKLVKHYRFLLEDLSRQLELQQQIQKREDSRSNATRI